MINKFITDKTKIYFKAYKVDGHIYIHANSTDLRGSLPNC